MTRLVAHLSDLHFGRVDDAIVEGALVDLARVKPALVIVSGDFTQRARRSEFKAARDFLARIPFPKLCVPGNHDIPLFDVSRRFFSPLARYRRFISDDLAPRYHDGELAVLGLNTARSTTWKDGFLSREQVDLVVRWATSLRGEAFRVVVTHHPFLPPEARPSERTVGGEATAALRAAEVAGVDLLLAGHLHEGYTGDVRRHHVTLGRSILVAQAGTATSTRTRGEANTFNLIDLDPARKRIVVEVRAWNGATFEATLRTAYAKDEKGAWIRGA